MISINLPSAQLGLNVSDPLDNMESEYAIQMDNLIPDTDGDRVRKGFVQKTSDAETVLIPVNVYGNEKIIASNGAKLKVYSVKDFSVIETDDTQYRSDEWTYCNFTDGAGLVHTFLANGVDIPIDYTTELKASTFTIPEGCYLDNPLSFKNRLYFVAGDFDICYSAVQSISGELTKFSMGSYFKKGGRILTIANWTQDAGSGSDDLFVVISTEGEVLIYKGLSPESDDWSMIGTFQIPKPVGKRCCSMLGADLIIITEKGYFPLSDVLSNLRANRTSISKNLNGIMREKNMDKRWDIFFYAKEGLLIVNAPSNVSKYAYEQHVLNFNTNAWCRFVGMSAESWCVIGDRAFFCNGDGIFEAFVGYTDNGQPIVYQVQRAYNQFGIPYKKQLMRIVPRYNAIGTPEMYKKVNVDFNDGKKGIISLSQQKGVSSYWDEAIWDDAFWSDEFNAYSTRSGVVSKAGNYISLGYWGRTKQEIVLYSSGLIIKNGKGHI